jgi:hypothetical protein
MKFSKKQKRYDLLLAGIAIVLTVWAWRLKGSKSQSQEIEPEETDETPLRCRFFIFSASQ